MKCQKCEKPATFHITELTGEDVMALHFCAECAEKYLKPSGGGETSVTSSALGGVLSQQLKIGQTAEELARLDQKTCPVCGISFYDFRQSGRLGCPHDYVYFKQELEPLLLNIHGATKHQGKTPARTFDADRQTQLIRLRREMKEAIESEEYELASKLRDDIKKIEEE
jgi:protein arginine kinase activator